MPISHRMTALVGRRLSVLIATFLMTGAVMAASAPIADGGLSTGPVYWGAEIGSQFTGNAAPWDMRAVTDFRDRVSHKSPSLIAFNIPWSSCGTPSCPYAFPTAQMQAIRSYGAIPMLNWASNGETTADEQAFNLKAIISGQFDSYLRSFATSVKQWGHPFLLRFDWEMNGNWFPWSQERNGNGAGEYVAAWRHVHDIFTDVGATNASWVWCPYVSQNPDALAKFYPGDQYVDWTCLNGYNWGPLMDGPNGWHSFQSLYTTSYDEVTDQIAPSKPMLIGEVGSSDVGGSEPAWISTMFNELPSQFPQIRALVWWETIDPRPAYQKLNLMLEDSAGASQAFARSIAGSRYAGNYFSDLSSSPITALSYAQLRRLMKRP